jgi:hypothetical protein
MRHNIYVPVPDQDTHREFNALWQVIERVTPILKEGGNCLTVWEIRNCDLANPRVKAAFATRGIYDLPALIAGDSIAVGGRAIENYFGDTIESCLEMAYLDGDERSSPHALYHITTDGIMNNRIYRYRNEN